MHGNLFGKCKANPDIQLHFNSFNRRFVAQAATLCPSGCNKNLTKPKYDRRAAQESIQSLRLMSEAENILYFSAPAFGFGDHLAMPPCHCHRLISLLSPRQCTRSWLPTSEQTPCERERHQPFSEVTEEWWARVESVSERGGIYSAVTSTCLDIHLRSVWTDSSAAYKWYRCVASGESSSTQIVWVYSTLVLF